MTVALQNVGSQSITDIPLSFFAGDPAQGGTLLHNETFAGPLEPGVTQTFDVTIGNFPANRSITIYGVADWVNSIDECNEADNQDPADNPISCYMLKL